jgi:hypothetical protein
LSQQRVVPVLKGEAYEILFGALKSKETKATYAFRQYLSYLNMKTPDELLLMDNATAQKKVIGYVLYLKNEK